MDSPLKTLRRDFAGNMIEQDDVDYDAARRSLFALGRPVYVLRPDTVADVQAGVRFAARTGLALSVRGGGHSFAGFGTNDGGVVIDLTNLASVELIDADHHIVRVGGGATWGGVATALAPHRLAISSGDTKSVGVGGLTLTGGIGWKVRRYGLALDQVVAAQVVLADGTAVRTNATENPQLFWAIRGGGGNFGIVTSFDFAAHPTTDLYFGRIAFQTSEAESVMKGWANYLRLAPDALTSVAILANPAAGAQDAPVEIFVAADTNSPDLARATLDPIRRLGTVISDDVALTPYADTLAPGAVPPSDIQFLSRSAFVEAGAVPAVLESLAEVATSTTPPAIAVRSVSGAVSRVPNNATAYAHRRAELMIVTLSACPESAVTATEDALDLVWARLAAHVNGAYSNFLSSATASDIAAIYPSNTLHRLATAKRKYDPRNLFAANHNVQPAPSQSASAGASRSAEEHPVAPRTVPRVDPMKPTRLRKTVR
jgi:FAD/FMN-containing dehydrogenase